MNPDWFSQNGVNYDFTALPSLVPHNFVPERANFGPPHGSQTILLKHVNPEACGVVFNYSKNKPVYFTFDLKSSSVGCVRLS